jgi:hypothetical protein
MTSRKKGLELIELSNINKVSIFFYIILDNQTKIPRTNNPAIGNEGTLQVRTYDIIVVGKYSVVLQSKSLIIFFHRYHYYGIGIKETSTYYHSVYSGKGLTRFVHFYISWFFCQLYLFRAIYKFVHT